MHTCPTGKRMFATEQHAEDALIEAHTTYDYRRGNGPVAIYKCDDCGNYHLTSQGPMNARLEQYVTEGKLSINKEANRWLDKFKKR